MDDAQILESEWRIARGEALLAHQRRIIAAIELARRDASRSKERLSVLEDSQRLLIAGRDQLRMRDARRRRDRA